MKMVFITLFLAGSFLTACRTDELGEIPPQDEKALIGMEDALFGIISYNDSLVSYVDGTGITNDSTCFYYDGQYHSSDSLYNMHHNNYSHGNGGDDHQCCNMMGNGNHGMTQSNYQQHMNNEHGQNGMEHHQEDHDFMNALNTLHEGYHPNN
jgi:hypothetical protein